MKLSCSTRSAADREAEDCRHGADHDRQDPDERRAHERAQEAAGAADDHHEQDLERNVDAETRRLGGAKPQEHHRRPGDAAVEGRYGEGQELGPQETDAHQLGGDIHVADHHPGPADPATDEIRGDPGQQRHDGEQREIARERRRVRAGDDDAKAVRVGTSMAPLAL